MRRSLLLMLCLFGLASCHSVRTVYDENGNKVDDSPKQEESDLSSHFEKQFKDAFSEKKLNGVPTSTSNRVSSYQKELDASRRENKEFITTSYQGKLTRSNLRDTEFDGSNKRFSGNKRAEKSDKVAYSNEMRPDFMNETHGISFTDRASADSADRTDAQGQELGVRSETYSTQASRYQTGDPDYYIEERRDKTPEPEVTDFREYYRQTINSTRSLLGRDKAP